MSVRIQGPASSGLVRGFSWSIIGNLSIIGAQMGSLLILANVGNADMAGEYGLAMALVVPVMTLTGLQLRGLLATDGKNQYRFGEYLGLRLITLGFALPLIIANILLTPPSSTVRTITILLMVRLSVFAVSDIYCGLLQQYERMREIAITNILTSALSLIVLGSVLILTGNLVLAVAGTAAVSVIPLIYYCIPATNRLLQTSRRETALRPSFSVGRLRSLFLLALPLGVVSFLISLTTNTPRYFLAASEGVEAVGIFFGLVSLFTAVHTAAGAIAQTISPRLARYFAAGNRREFILLLCRLEGIALVCGVFGLAVVSLVGDSLVRLILSGEFAGQPNTLKLLTISSILSFMALFIGNALTVGRLLTSQVVTNVACLGALTIVCFLLVPNYGLTGAAAAVAISAGVRLILNLAILVRFLARWRVYSTSTYPKMSIG